MMQRVKQVDVEKKGSRAKIWAYFLTIILVMMVPLIVLYFFFTHIIVEKQEQANRNFVQNVAASCDQLFSALRTDTSDLVTQGDYIEYNQVFLRYGDNFANSARRMAVRLSNIPSAYPLVKGAFLYSQTSGGAEFLLSAVGSFDVDTFFQHSKASQGITLEAFREALEGRFSMRLLAPEPGLPEGSDLSYTLLLKMQYSANPRNFIGVQIDKQSLYSMATRQNITGQGYLYLLDLTSGRFINIEDSLQVVNPENTQRLIQAIQEAGADEISLNGRAYILSQRESLIGGLHYIVLTPKALLLDEISRFFLTVLWVALAFSGLSMLVAFNFAKWIHQPLKGLLTKLTETQNQFQALATDYSMLSSYARKGADVGLELLLTRLVAGEACVPEIRRFAQSHGILGEGMRLQMLCVLLGGEAAHGHIDWWRQALGPDAAVQAWPVLHTPTRYAVLYAADTEHALQSTTEALAQKARRWMREAPGATVQIGQSGSFGDIGEMQARLRIAEASVEWCAVRSYGKVLLSREDIGSDAGEPIDLQTRERLRGSVAALDVSGARAALEAMFAQSMARNPSLASYRRWANELLLALVADAAQAFPEAQVEGQAMQPLLRQVAGDQSPQACREQVLSACDGLLTMLKEQVNAADTLHNILAYIDEAQGAVQLTEIANRFGYAPNYFSQYFKKHTGYTFTQHTNTLRVAGIKRLLDTTEKTIQEISDDLGFANPSSLIRLFKSIEGVTPQVYRKRELGK